MSAKTIRLTVADAHSRHDLVVPADSTVAELLTVGGVDLSRYVSTSTSGAAIALDSEVSVAPGDGGVIWLFERGAEDAATPAAQRGAAARRQTLRQRWAMLALLLTVGLGIVAGTVIAPSPATISLSAIVLLLGALVLLAQPLRDENTYIAFVAPLLATGAGALALAGFGDAGAMMAAGTVAGATVACVRHARARLHSATAAATTSVIAVLWSVFAVLSAAGFIAAIPAAAITAVQLACAAPIFHFMRGAALDVEPDELIDVPYVIRDAQGIRALPPNEPSPIRLSGAEQQVLIARRRAEAGTISACVLALASAWYTLATIGGPSVETWCVLGGTLGVGGYFLLTSRKLRDGLTRGAALVTGAVLAVFATAELMAALHIAPLLIALGLVAVGVLVGCLTVPLSRDWRSLGWSRTGDIVEGIFLALAPAALLYGSGIATQILEVFS